MDDAAARADFQPARTRELVARTDARGEHDHVGVQMRAVGELHAVACRPRRRRSPACCAACAPVTPSSSILLAQHAAAAFVDLHRHQARRELDHMRLEAHVAQRLRAFETEQAAADHRAGLRARAAFLHRFEVLDSAVDEAVRAGRGPARGGTNG